MAYEGGVAKEFFQLLVRDLFNVGYGMFTYNDATRTFCFSQTSMESESEYNLVRAVLYSRLPTLSFWVAQAPFLS
eukprot:SM000074S21656  [mRNA]  locus=s74:90716:91436:+ [translate_table: standard]